MNRLALVVLLLEPDCGERAIRLAEFAHVWLVESDSNSTTARAFRATHSSSPAASRHGSLTTFTQHGTTPEEWAESAIVSIEDHHNERASVVPYTTLVVEGAQLNAELRESLQEAGFVELRSTPFGFVASK